MVKIRNHTVCQAEIIWREYKLVGPALIRFQHAVCPHCCFSCLCDACSNSTNTMSCSFCLIYYTACFSSYLHLLWVHLVLCQILNFNIIEISKTTMQGYESVLYSRYLHTLQHLSCEMETCCGCCHSSLRFSENTLEIIHVILGHRTRTSTIHVFWYNVAWQRRLA